MDDVEALEQAAVLALPPALTEHVGGWLLRATPGVGRRRINAVLLPRRADPAELPVVLDRARAFAEQHGHELIVQVTPYAEQAPLDAALTSAAGPSRSRRMCCCGHPDGGCRLRRTT